MVTMESTCAAICSLRGVRSTTLKLATQAAMLTAIKNASRKKVRQSRPLLSQLRSRASAPSGLDAIGYEHITQTPNGLDKARTGRIGFDQFAQTRNLNIKAAIEYLVLATTCQLH